MQKTNVILWLYERIIFVMRSVFRGILGFFISLFIRRDKNIVLFGNYPIPFFKSNKRTEQFMHNTKYLFLYLTQNETGLKIIYLCDDKNKRETFIKKGYKNVYSRKSLKGIYYTLRAKYWITDYDTDSVADYLLSYKAVIINVWHGMPFKKIIFTEKRYSKDMTKLISKIWNVFRPKNNYIIANNTIDQQIYVNAFIMELKNIIIKGSPRLDVFYNDIKDKELFMEEDFENIKHLKEQGKHLIIYMPTFRDTGKDILGWLNSEKIRALLKKNNAVLLCKIHPADKNSVKVSSCEEIYIMDGHSDVYSVLKYTDILITDYSSINFDYLLLDKPIIYYPLDFEEYQQKCRELFTSYKEFTVGEIANTENELLQAIQNAIEGIDNFKEQRKVLRDKMFKYQDGKNCRRVAEWIKSLDN